jgi:hypothetical protein
MTYGANSLHIYVMLRSITKIMVVFVPTAIPKMSTIGTRKHVRVRQFALLNHPIDAAPRLEFVSITSRTRKWSISSRASLGLVLFMIIEFSTRIADCAQTITTRSIFAEEDVVLPLLTRAASLL